MEAVGKIWEVKNGIIAKVVFDGQVFVPEKKVVLKEAGNTHHFTGPKPPKYSRDQKVGESCGVSIWKPILDEIVKGKSIVKVLRKEYPDINEDSLKKYEWIYRKWILKTPKGVRGKRGPYKKKHKKHHREQPSNTIGFDTTYNTWIRNDEHGLITRSLRKYGFKATTKNIVEETRLKIGRINATLHYMVAQGEAYKNVNPNTGETVYLPKEGKETIVSI